MSVMADSADPTFPGPADGVLNLSRSVWVREQLLDESLTSLRSSATLSQPDAGDPALDGPPPAARDVDPTALPTPPGLQSARAPILAKDRPASRTKSKSLPFH
ncbi:unnamed protein product [Lampetra fluviatilis]